MLGMGIGFMLGAAAIGIAWTLYELDFGARRRRLKLATGPLPLAVKLAAPDQRLVLPPTRQRIPAIRDGGANGR